MATTNNNNGTKKVFTEVTIDETERTAFLQGLDGKGDIVEGVYKGSVDIDFKNDKGLQKIHKIEIDNIIYYLPSNYELNAKLNKLQQIKDGAECNIQIECLGFKKLDGGKRVKLFKVLND